METAKDILRKHTGFKPEDNWVFEEQVMAIAREIADKAWEAGRDRGEMEELFDTEGHIEGSIDKSTFMKSLFPATSSSSESSSQPASPAETHLTS